MGQHLIKFQQLLRELFQFDCADLDFGIYRIMNRKRDLLVHFITEALPKAISKELEQGALARQGQAAKELEAAKEKVLEMSRDALDPAGNLIKYHDTTYGRDYLKAQEKAKSVRGHEALEAVIYNHLYAFFNRYWQDGDFISKRRYSKWERYAIPYNGEEVILYWANRDQYYIKTGEHFTNYRWQGPQGVTVHFKLLAADVEQDNVKGERRFFIPRLKEISWDEPAKSLTIPFEFRPLNEQETIAYGRRNQQETIIAKAVEDIPGQKSIEKATAAMVALKTKKRSASDGREMTFLEHHLRQYTRRNTSDFFIHKDLKGFLLRELDFYLKNEVLNLEEMEAAGESLAEGWFQTMRLIKNIGGRIIEFLAQIEEFQKMLWEKRKFITDTFYCITVGQIPEKFYSEIAVCKSQWEEWKALFHIDEEENLLTIGKNKNERRLKFLKHHPTLVLDTRHFPTDFIDRLLASFDNLDEITDGLLVHSENWQALNLLREKYRECIQCIHIDPPYNTQTSGFLYKNNYKHSSWLAMMESHLFIVRNLISEKGHLLCHIDENEYERLNIFMDTLGIADAGTVIWDKRNPMTAGRGIATQHEYIIWRSWVDDSIYQRNTNIMEMLATAKTIIDKHGGVSTEAREEYANWIRENTKLTGGEKAYRYLDEKGRIYQSVSLRAPEPRTNPKFFEPLIHPVTKKPCAIPPNGFSRTPETLKLMITRGEILFGEDETTQPRQKRFLTGESRMQARSIIQDAKKGKADLDVLGLNFPYCHPVSLYKELVAATTMSGKGIVSDYFAGSGTTGHAVINLNREDGGRRKFILVEMAQYFDTVMLPRLKKITFSSEWKDGRPVRPATPEEAERSPRLIKVIRLESYEDALNNIAFDEPSGQQVLQFEDYLLQYMLHWETRNCETLLNVGKLTRPFSYQLSNHRDLTAGRINGEAPVKNVDLPETFAYLMGLFVEKRQVLSDNGRRYLVYKGTTRQGRRTVVIWREIEGWTAKDFKRDRDFVAGNKLTRGMDDIYVNGDSSIPGAQALEKPFKEKMFAPVEV